MTLAEPDPREQPRCLRCGHRRIRHFVGARVTRRVLREREVPCSLWVDGWPCGCDTYVPTLSVVT